MKKKVITLAIIALSLVLGYFISSVFKSNEVGEFKDHVVDNNTTIYFFVDDSSDTAKSNNSLVYENFTKLALIHPEVSINVINSDNVSILNYKETFRFSNYPTLLVLNSNGKLVSFQEEMIDYPMVDNLLNELNR